VETMERELGAQQGSAVKLQSYSSSLEQQLACAERQRIELHNTIQELKGNIRVYCRVRPTKDGSEVVLQLQEPNKLMLTCGFESHAFTFDKVFSGHSTQADVFHEVSGLVQSALDGYKVCIFAYGQTGSGKTYTMQGSDEPGCSGLIPRTLVKLFKEADNMRARGWNWSFSVSLMEVYNENLRDLLRSTGDAAAGPIDRHVITQHEAWGAMVTGMSNIEVQSVEQITELMNRAIRQRAVGATDMNVASSRSHSVFALYLQGFNEMLGTELCGALHMVDLAGSERLDRSGSTGDRLKETQNINRSLSSLADVFAAKAEARTHIPFRNSRLTHLMEPCLSGQGKTLMLVNIQPELENSQETLCSLRFARQVSQCTTGGKPRRSAKQIGSAPTQSRVQRAVSPQAQPAMSPQRSPRPPTAHYRRQESVERGSPGPNNRGVNRRRSM